MKTRLFSAVFATMLAFGLGACTVDQTDEGEAPTVDPGELPEYDVEPADIDVDWDTTTVRTPDIDINQDPDTARVDTTTSR